jgi:aminoglycoside phosphotransferase (APT) family kinase protein
MPGRPVAPLLHDPDLPSLAQALDGAAMLPHLAAALGLEAIDGLRCSAEVLSHKHGRRCTIRYALRRDGDEAPLARAAGKVYQRHARAQDAFRRLRDLQPAFATGDVRVPNALAVVRPLTLVLQEYAGDQDVRHALADGTGEAPIALAAEFLARLHALPPLEHLRTRDVRQTLEKTAARVDKISIAQPALEGPLRAVLFELQQLAPAMDVPAASMIHKDFYYAHTLWDGETVWVVDFDELHIGDPAFDVGHFLAHLANLAFRQTGRPDAYAREASVFLERYLERAPAGVRDRVPFYRAYTFVKLAATDVARKRDGWRERAALLTDLAGRA